MKKIRVKNKLAVILGLIFVVVFGGLSIGGFSPGRIVLGGFYSAISGLSKTLEEMVFYAFSLKPGLSLSVVKRYYYDSFLFSIKPLYIISSFIYGYFLGRILVFLKNKISKFKNVIQYRDKKDLSLKSFWRSGKFKMKHKFAVIFGLFLMVTFSWIAVMFWDPGSYSGIIVGIAAFPALLLALPVHSFVFGFLTLFLSLVLIFLPRNLRISINRMDESEIGILIFVALVWFFYGYALIRIITFIGNKISETWKGESRKESLTTPVASTQSVSAASNNTVVSGSADDFSELQDFNIPTSKVKKTNLFKSLVMGLGIGIFITLAVYGITLIL